jgi:hypothetical protein
MARKNPRRNISRIETTNKDGKTYGGWEVRMQRQGIRFEKFFSDLVHGGKRAALQAAKEHRDDLESYYPKSTVKQLAKQTSVRNRSGVVGVRLHKQKDRRGDFEYQYWYWVAQWTDGNGRRKTRSFSIHQHGDDEAYEMAVEARTNGVSKAKR